MKIWKELPPKQRTLVELYGRERVLVEAHGGILSFSEDCIRVIATYGVLVIRGQKLWVCCMSREQLIIRGNIAQVELEVGR